MLGFISFVFILNILIVALYFIQKVSISWLLKKSNNFSHICMLILETFSFVDYDNFLFFIFLLAFLSKLQEFFSF